MIEGFRVLMTSSELADHLRARARWHDDQASALGKFVHDSIEGRLPKTALDHIERDVDLDDVKAERDRARELAFFAEHLEPDEEYRLARDDLEFLELVIINASGRLRRF